MIIFILGLFEIISIAIFAIMSMCDGFIKVIPRYEDSDKCIGLTFMAFLGGWIFAPYFGYLAYKYITRNKK